MAIEDREDYARLKAECQEDIERAILVSCIRAECDDECPAKRGCEHVCRVCGDKAETRCVHCRLWFCWEHDSPHESLCPTGKDKKVD